MAVSDGGGGGEEEEGSILLPGEELGDVADSAARDRKRGAYVIISPPAILPPRTRSFLPLPLFLLSKKTNIHHETVGVNIVGLIVVFIGIVFVFVFKIGREPRRCS